MRKHRAITPPTGRVGKGLTEQLIIDIINNGPSNLQKGDIARMQKKCVTYETPFWGKRGYRGSAMVLFKRGDQIMSNCHSSDLIPIQ